ncbi:unnamed protein product [Caenorhabditis auriculariae]|uniref:Uncharacterized protein n=1 Tax=Caenorhabditis auriculariae TaxID=2777116 RepID=A0A8S1H161_9PELO|nr:unnamed protein product [Caenorhabditis auriculariae]
MPYVGVGAQQDSHKALLNPSMMKAYAVLGVSLLLILAVAAMGKHHSERIFNHHKAPTLEDVHKSTTDSLLQNIDVERIKQYLRRFTKEPHVAGTEANKKVAYAIASAWSEAGLDDVHTIPYEVLLSYPKFDIPNRVIIKSSNGKEIFRSSGVSPVIIAEEQSGKYAGHQWLAWSANGSVSGEVVYCNRGSDNDFKNLAHLGASVEGKIALMRYGEGFRGDKVHRAQKNGAIGAILFSDPSDVAADGTDETQIYPNTIWMPHEGVQRGSCMHGDGDPLTPYHPSKKDLFKSKTIEEAKEEGVIPSIPVLPISYSTAYEIMSRMKGRIAPSSWQGKVGENLTYKLGPGFSKDESLTINVYSELTTRRIRNIIGYIRGSQEPDRYVMLGNHFDAWVYGSMDPNSGTAILAEVARAMMQTINETSWRPARTIVFNAWDAEEYGLIGSTEFVEEFVDILQKRAVVYINMDTLVANTSISVDTVPTLHNIVMEVAKKIPNPVASERKKGRETVFDTWMATFPLKDGTAPEIGIPNGGSDQAPFLNFAGIPVVNFEFKNATTRDTYPLYHTMYETPFTNEHLIDTDNMKIHQATGQFWAELARSFADAPVLPINTTKLGHVIISEYLPILKNVLSKLSLSKEDAEMIKTQYKFLLKNCQEMLHMSEKFEETIAFTQHSFSKNPYDMTHIAAINERLMSSERCFVNPRGTLGRNPSARHVLFSVSESDSYSGSLMAGIGNAVDAYKNVPNKKNAREVANQISVVQYSVKCVLNTLREVI